MIYDLQKASLLKRVSAWLLDAILLCVLMVGCIWMISGLVGYDAQSQKLENYYTQYETQYHVSFDYVSFGYSALTDEEKAAYDAMTEAERIAFDEAYRAACDEAYQAMIQNDDVIYTYNLVLQMTILMVCVGLFLAMLILEFLVPLLFGHGRTVGKRVFNLAVMRTDSVQIRGISLFIRAVLGKYAIETMVPVFVVTMWLLGILGFGGTLVLAVLLVVQVCMLIATPTNALIHDKLSDTVVVDMSSQMIFATREARLAYQKDQAAETAQQQHY